MLDQLALLATHRPRHRDLVPGAQRQRLGQQPARGDLVREQDELRRRLVVVELGDKGFQHLLHREALVGAGEIGAVAPIVAVAEEEHLDAGLARLLMRGEHVSLLHRLRIDALTRLDVAERGQPVAETRRAFVVLLEARAIHQGVQPALHLVALAGKESERLVDQRAVILGRDLAGARRRAALDLEQQAGPQPRLVIGVGARAQQKGALQRVDGAADRAGRGEWTEIIAFAVTRAAMLEDLCNGMVAGDEDEGERLVVPEHHVEARLEPLDQIRLEQQSLDLGRGGDELHARRVGDHPRDAVIVASRPRVALHALLEVPRLADIEHLARAIDHAVDAGACRRRLGIAANHRRAGLHPADGLSRARKERGCCAVRVL